MKNNFPEVASAEAISTKQKLFLRYFTAILVDLVVLNLFAEYWQHVQRQRGNNSCQSSSQGVRKECPSLTLSAPNSSDMRSFSLR
jgi:hypothetical protein